MAEETSFTANVKGVADLIENDLNKVSGSGLLSPEGPVGDTVDVLDLSMSDEELLDLRYSWEKIYAPYEGKLKPIFKRNLNSYLGRQKDGSLLETDVPGPANLQFEAEETFLPAALAQNPDPVVYCDNSPEGNAIADSVKTMLQYHADQLLLRRKFAVMVRQWSIYHLATLKYGWNAEINDVSVENRKIQDFIFDPNGYVDVFGDFSSWLGERITVTAERLTELFPKHKDYIEKSVIGPDGKTNLGTEVTYTEWWTDKFCFTTYKNKVLDKHKNEFFNYDEEKVDELTGLKIPAQRNHFASPKKPYVFLSVFSLQERPHDITGLIEQNIPNQAKISKRVEQLDENISQSNNSFAFSENNFTQETAKQAANALTKGVGKVLIPPGGPIGEAIVRLEAPAFPEVGFKELEMSENHLHSSWGVQGIVSQEPKPDETARGMILNQGRDTSRIGGGISDIVEQSVARGIYNALVQLYCVFYDEKHFAAVMGTGKAVQYVTLSAQDINRQLIVSVSPNSMMPKDEIAIANEAQNLFKLGGIGPKTLLERMNFPNADEAAADGVLWKADPGAYIRLNFPELYQQLAQIAQEQAQAQMQAQQQELAQSQAQAEQGLNQKEQAHQQKLRQGEEAHRQKLEQSKEAASSKLAQVPMPK